MATMRTRSQIVVIEHEAGCPLDRLAGWLEGVDVRMVRPYVGEPVPPTVEDGLIVLGGQMSAYDDAAAPWLPEVRDLLGATVRDAVPTLGICLGAQLLAVAAGGSVTTAAAPGRESGVIDVRWREAAASDRLLAGLPDPFAGPSMHADAVEALPPGAAWLGTSAMYPHQAFRVGSAAWGIQFHPEVSLETFRAWADGHAEVDTAAVTAEFRARDAEVVVAGRGLARRFAGLVTTSAGAPGRARR
jgi:GMP synthase (glutamine-hydrolysing)